MFVVSVMCVMSFVSVLRGVCFLSVLCIVSVVCVVIDEFFVLLLSVFCVLWRCVYFVC